MWNFLQAWLSELHPVKKRQIRNQSEVRGQAINRRLPSETNKRQLMNINKLWLHQSLDPSEDDFADLFKYSSFYWSTHVPYYQSTSPHTPSMLQMVKQFHNISVKLIWSVRHGTIDSTGQASVKCVHNLDQPRVS